MNIRNTIKVIFVASFVLTPFLTLAEVQPKEAVWLYIDSSATQVAPGSEIIVSLRIDSIKPVNAFEVEIIYLKSLLNPVLFDDSSSVVDLWKTKQWEENNGIIKLSGGMIKPFSGVRGTIAEFRFKALYEGTVQISFNNANAYYADGIGTRAEIFVKPAEITITKNASLLNPQQKDDTAPPMFDFVKTAKNPADGKYLVIFNAKDMGSGIRVVYLQSMQWFTFDQWKPVSSPVELPKGTWQYQLSAVDNNGNTSIKTLYVPMEIVKKLSIIILLFLILSIFYVIIRKWIFLKKLS